VSALSAAATERLTSLVKGWTRPQPLGSVVEIAGTLIQIAMSGVSLGDVVVVETPAEEVMCEVVGFRGQTLLAIPLQPARQIAPGAVVRLRGAMAELAVGDALIGRLIDPFGNPLDGQPAPRCTSRIRLDGGALPIEQRAEVAAVGEITLRGSVLPVEGIKDKILAAHRAGIREVVLPAKNERDVEEIPKEILEDIQLRYVNRADEVLRWMLERPPTENPRTLTRPSEPPTGEMHP